VDDIVISVIIPTFNSMRCLRDCLESVVTASQRCKGVELIIIDNGSADGTYEYLVSNYASRARLFQIKDVTVAGLRNYGARISRAQYLSFIDSDCVIPPDYFQSALAVFASRDADATGNYYDLPQSTGWVQETWYNLNRRATNRYVPYLFAGNFIVKRSVFELVGGFDETLITGEDAELGVRMTKAGYKIFASADVSALHLAIQRSVAEFFRKNAWHGLGMFGSARIVWFDKPLLMTFAHILFTAAGLISLFCASEELGLRLAVLLLLSLAVPSAAVVYRTAKRGQVYRPLRSLLLFYVFFTARIYAVFFLTWNRISGARRGRKPLRS
jgi:glycosyltransferase involved in cell wall biosynthesis